MDELAGIVKNQGPLGAVVVVVLIYFMKVLVPQFQAQVDRLIEAFRGDMAAARKEFTEALRDERAAHEAAVKEAVTAFRAAIDHGAVRP